MMPIQMYTLVPMNIAMTSIMIVIPLLMSQVRLVRYNGSLMRMVTLTAQLARGVGHVCNLMGTLRIKPTVMTKTPMLIQAQMNFVMTLTMTATA